MKKNLTTLVKIQACLRDVLLPVKETGLDYQTIKNLSKLDRYIETKKQDAEEVNKKFQFKDPDGEPIMYQCTAIPNGNGMATFDKDANGDFIALPKGDKKLGAPRVDETSKDYIEAIKELEEDIDFEFHMFPNDKIKAAFDNGILSGLDLSPLFGYLIDENL